MPFVVEEGDVAENLEFLHHIWPVPVEFVDVLDQLGDVVGHGCQLCTCELVVRVHSDAGYHSDPSRSVCCWRARRASLRRAPSVLGLQTLSVEPSSEPSSCGRGSLPGALIFGIPEW